MLRRKKNCKARRFPPVKERCKSTVCRSINKFVDPQQNDGFHTTSLQQNASLLFRLLLEDLLEDFIFDIYESLPSWNLSANASNNKLLRLQQRYDTSISHNIVTASCIFMRAFLTSIFSSRPLYHKSDRKTKPFPQQQYALLLRQVLVCDSMNKLVACFCVVLLQTIVFAYLITLKPPILQQYVIFSSSC